MSSPTAGTTHDDEVWEASRTPTVLSGWTHTLIETLEGHGLDGERMARTAGIDLADFDVPYSRIPMAASATLWNAAVSVTGNQYLGLEVATHVRPASFHAASLAILCSETLHDALVRMARYGTVVADVARARIDEVDGHLEMRIGWVRGAPRPNLFAVDAILASVVVQCQLLVGQRVSPVEVHLERLQPGEPERFSDFFGCPVTFDNPESRLVFDQATVDVRLPTGDGELARANDQIVASYLEGLHASPTLRSRVRTVLIDLLPGGEPTAASVADLLHISSRSLQRRLHEEGTSFRAVLEDLRCELAKSYLRTGMLTMVEITRLVGFRDQATFSRAFKRWTGTSPSRFVED